MDINANLNYSWSSLQAVSEQPVITIRRGKLVCEIRNGTDPELLRQILRLVDHHV